MIELNPYQILENKRVRLEPMQWDHFSHLLPICLEHPTLLRYSPPNFGTKAALEAYFEKNLALQKEKRKCPWVIYDKQQEAYAGSTSYLNISLHDKRLEIGSTWLAPAHQRTGLNRNCKYLLLTHAFTQLQIERVELKTDLRNEQSRKAILAIGATYEGALRSHTLLSDGHRRDTAYYSILRSEWGTIRERVFASYE